MSWVSDQMKQGMNARTYVLGTVLLLVLVWVHFLDVNARALKARRAGVPAPPPAVVAPPPQNTPSIQATATPQGWGSDPFAPRVADTGETPGKGVRTPRTAASAKTGLYLQGIMEGPLGRTALINGEIYREGQRVGSREVIQIGRNSVMLLDHGTVTTLTLQGDGS